MRKIVEKSMLGMVWSVSGDDNIGQDVTNTDTFVKAAFGNRKKLDALLDELFYDYNNK